MKLVDATKRAAKSSRFQIPSAEQRRNVRPGQIAKVIFCDGKRGCERMWVVVEKADGCSYTGRLDNVPAAVRARLGQRVRFHCKNIIDITGDGGGSTAGTLLGLGLLGAAAAVVLRPSATAPAGRAV